MAKLTEKCFQRKLKRFVSLNWSHGQTGFLIESGTSINIKRILEWVQNNKKQKGILLYIDFKKAMDSVSQWKLFEILRKRKSLDENEIRFIEFFYTKLRISTNNNEKEIVRCERDFIQGSCLSPFFFNIYIDCLFRELEKNGINNERILGYADDISLGLKDEFELKKAVNIIEHWSANHHLSVNKSKYGITQLALTISSKRRFDQTQLTIFRGYPIINEYCYLGISMDYRLTQDA